CCNALRRSSVNEAEPFVVAMAQRVASEGRTADRTEVGSLMRFLGKDSVTDKVAAWNAALGMLDLTKLDKQMAAALGSNANPELTKAVLGSLPKEWDVVRVRQEALDAMANRRGHSNENVEEISRMIGGEP